MPQFKEWLAEQAAQRTNINHRQQRVEEWTTVVADLLAQIVRWLAEDDTQNILTVETARLRKSSADAG